MNERSTLYDIGLFVEVARTASFSRAGINLRVPGATLSRRIAAMERSLGVRLFDRTTRHVELTDAGRRYFERCAHLVDEALLAQEALQESTTRATGHVRLSMPVDLGVTVIGPLLAEFSRAFPGISFDLDLSSRRADLVGEAVDLAIRLGEVKKENLVARQIGAIEQRLFASPSYLTMYGQPKQPADLSAHECIVSRTPQRQALWQLRNETDSVEVRVKGRFMANNVGLMRVLAERHMGVALLDPSLVRQSLASSALVPVLSTWSAPPLPVFAVIASRMQPASVRAVLEFLVGRFRVV